jgi:leucine dehydrogenase
MQILEYMQGHGYEQLVACHDPSVGLKAFIAIYDTTLGPALGGVRLWPYSNEEEALTDVLRLARALAYKCAVADLAFGGGKAAIIADQASKTEALIRAFARFVDTLGGRFIVSEDIGTDTRDLERISWETRHVAGLTLGLGGSGDPAVITALGVVMAMKSCAKAVWGSESLEGRRVAIQGFGKVGTHAAEQLIKEGAKILAADTDRCAVERARDMGAEIVSPDDIYSIECEIFSPCALGGVLNSTTIPRLKAKVVAGGANNQLLSSSDGDVLHQRGIIYAPDYVASSAGCIALHHEVYGNYHPRMVPEFARRVGAIMDQVLHKSRTADIPTYRVADRIAEKRMRSVRQLRPIFRHTSRNGSRTV